MIIQRVRIQVIYNNITSERGTICLVKISGTLPAVHIISLNFRTIPCLEIVFQNFMTFHVFLEEETLVHLGHKAVNVIISNVLSFP